MAREEWLIATTDHRSWKERGKHLEGKSMRRITVVTCIVLLLAACADSAGTSTTSTSENSTSSTAIDTSTTTTTTATTTSEPAETVEFTIGGYSGSLLNVPAFIGIDEGIFAAHGLDVELLDVASGPEHFAAVIGGDLDMAYHAASAPMQIRTQGQDFVGVVGTATNIYVVVARSDVPTPNSEAAYPEMLADVAGRTFGVTGRGAESEVIARSMLSDAGLDVDRDVSFVAAGAGPNAIAALTSGAVDFAITFEPVITRLLATDEIKVVLDLRKGEGPPEYAEWQQSGYWTLRENVEARPADYRRFREAMADVYAFMADVSNQDRIVEIFVERTDTPEDIAASMVAENIPTAIWYDYGPTFFNPQGITNVTNFLVANDLLAQDDVLAYEDLVWMDED